MSDAEDRSWWLDVPFPGARVVLGPNPAHSEVELAEAVDRLRHGALMIFAVGYRNDLLPASPVVERLLESAGELPRARTRWDRRANGARVPRLRRPASPCRPRLRR